MQKYVILCAAGQSNAVGYDESLIPPDYLDQFDRSRIAQLGFFGGDDLKIVPLGACAQNFQDLRPFGHPDNAVPNQGTRGIHLPLAHLLLPLIPEDCHILVLPCAYGGAGFTTGERGGYDEAALRPEPGVWRWGKDSPYYRAMRDRIAYALELDPGNRFLGVLWVQGEQDAADAAGHWAGFTAMTEDFFAWGRKNFPGRVYRGDWDRDIWFNMETVAYWYTQGQCPQIWDNYRAWNPATYVEIPRQTHSNEINGTGLTAAIRGAHFGDGAFAEVIAPLAAEQMKKVILGKG